MVEVFGVAFYEAKLFVPVLQFSVFADDANADELELVSIGLFNNVFYEL